MSIQGIHGTTPPLVPPGTASDSSAAAVRSRGKESVEPSTTASTDGSESKPAPLRFPWLSRLSLQLAAASKQPAPFSAPIIGDNLDKQA